MCDITLILSQIEQGDPNAASELLPLVYEELRKLAAAKLALEKPGQTLQATAIVHEAYLRLVDTEQNERWNGRGHFFGAAAEAMRRILVDRARRKQAVKHGGEYQRNALDCIDSPVEGPSDQLLAVHEALDTLAEDEPQAAELLKLRYFAGLGQQEAASVMGIGRRTADRLWAVARARLYRELHEI
jgi:RNA polymerase sigma factor (TIGR02999 family)